jgi:Domain of Unknown Function (DUF1080)
MKRLLSTFAAMLLLAATLGGFTSNAQAQAAWTTLFDGTHANDWTPIGNANWRLVDGVLVADVGTGFLVSKKSYTDFEIRAEFWVDPDANSGIFIRCADATKVTADNAYEVNIFDKRPDPSYGTGAIVNVAKIANMPKAGGKWNTYEITAKGPEMTVVLNGVQTVQARDSKLASGPIALQYAGGTVKFRKVQIRAL